MWPQNFDRMGGVSILIWPFFTSSFAGLSHPLDLHKWFIWAWDDRRFASVLRCWTEAGSRNPSNTIACFTILHMLLCQDCFQSPISHDTTSLVQYKTLVESCQTSLCLCFTLSARLTLGSPHAAPAVCSILDFLPNCHPVQRGRLWWWCYGRPRWDWFRDRGMIRPAAVNGPLCLLLAPVLTNHFPKSPQRSHHTGRGLIIPPRHC